MKIFGKKNKGGEKVSGEVLSTTSAEIRAKGAPKPLPIIGKLAPAMQHRIAGTLLVTSLAVAAGLGYMGVTRLASDTSNTETATTIQMLTQRLAKAAQLATTGDESGIKQVRDTRIHFERQMKILAESGDGGSAATAESLAGLKKSVDGLLGYVDAIIKLEGDLRQVKKQSATSKRAGSEMTMLAEQLAAVLYQRGASGMHISLSNHIFNVSQRMSRNADALLTDDSVDPAVLGEFSVDFKDFGEFLALLTVGDRKTGVNPVTDADSRAIVIEMSEAFKAFTEVADYINKNASSIVNVKRNVANIYKLSDESLAKAEALSQNYPETQAVSQTYIAGAGLAVLVALFSIILFSLISGRLARINAFNSQAASQDSEDSIINLMREMQPIGDGDLTAEATVTDSVTGGIAGMLNETIASVRAALGAVLEIVRNVGASVKNSEVTTKKLIDSAKTQGNEITNAVNAVGDLTKSIKQVSDNTKNTAEVARNAKKVTEEGRETVDEVNKAMSGIRENMQNVLKGVKRLGETSQEIGGIVETIDDIVDKTQVLAVNASLQAAAAGEAGHGFRVVAGEVKRLAEMSAGALKVIIALVQRNQGETQASISEVETATAYVVKGAELSEKAGSALNEVSAVVDQVHSLLESINQATTEQSVNAENVSEIMDRLRKISREAMDSVVSSARSVSDINKQMLQLQESVSKFKVDKKRA